MAEKSSSKYRVDLEIDQASQLGDEWESWKQNFSSDAAAARQAIRRELLESGEETDEEGLAWHHFAVAGLMAGAIGSLVAQAMLVFDVVVATGLTALALLVVGGVMYAHGD